MSKGKVSKNVKKEPTDQLEGKKKMMPDTKSEGKNDNMKKSTTDDSMGKKGKPQVGKKA